MRLDIELAKSLADYGVVADPTADIELNALRSVLYFCRSSTRQTRWTKVMLKTSKAMYKIVIQMRTA
jgi:hypothetical protein